MARRFGSAMISNTDSICLIYADRHIRVKTYKMNILDYFRMSVTEYEVGGWCLFARPRTGDEDIYESSGALLPVGAGGDVGDADQCPK